MMTISRDVVGSKRLEKQMEQLPTAKNADPMGLKIRRSKSDEETESRGYARDCSSEIPDSL